VELERTQKMIFIDKIYFFARSPEGHHHPIHYLETFVDTERYAGTCYYAANWKFLGKTTGRRIKEKAQRVTRSIKDVLGYPLSNDFRLKLCHGKETKTS